ncbi:MAG TPA: hypothetical protein VKX16_03235 [Chloroflexota bacterium]|nr:hypothetical protein [Chloroflexota bacterium]
MTRQEDQQESQDRELALQGQRAQLEADLSHVAQLIDTELAEWVERRSAVQALGQGVDDRIDDGADEVRMAWYLAAYEDAQHAVVVTQGLTHRYNDIARALTTCQQELMQLPRDHRRG